MGEKKFNSKNASITGQKEKKLLKNDVLKTCLPLSEAETLKLIQEFEVYKVELERQNEELKLAKKQSEDDLQKYKELYDFAPSGYFTLSKEGVIIELNPSGANMLGKESSRLRNSRFGFFVSCDTRLIFNLFLEKVFNTKNKESCVVMLPQNGNAPIYVNLTGSILENGEHCLVSALDITSGKQVENTHNFLLKSGYPGSNNDFFETLARYLAVTLDMGYVCIDRLEEDGLTAHTVAIFNDGKFDPNVAYTLKETPCGEVVGKTVCCFPENVCRLFPNDSVLRDLKAESYIGTTLWSFDGKPIGLIAVIGRMPLKDSALSEAILKLVAIRAAGELERRQAEEAMREKNSRLNLAMQASDMTWWDMDITTGNVTFGERKAEMLGYLPENFSHYKDFMALVHPEDSDKPMHAMQGHLEGLFDKYESEYRILTRSGVYKWFYDIGSVVKRDPEGKPLVITGIVMDISMRKEASEAIRISEKRRLAILDTAMDGYWLLNKDGCLVEVNETYCRMSGYSSEELLTMRIPDFDINEAANETSAHIQKIMSQGEERFESRHRRKDGSIFNVEVSALYQHDEGGQFVVFLHDITQRKLAEEEFVQLYNELENRVKERTEELLASNVALQLSEEKFRTVADFTYDWEYWINADGSLQYMSPSAERITGYTAGEFKANPQLLNQIVFVNDLELWESHILESHSPDSVENHFDIIFRIVSKTGDLRWIGHICTRILVDGKFLGLRVSNRDLTEKVKAENDLLNVTVEVEERERNHFASELHDGLGPLLSTVKLYFQWLAETDDPEKAKIITKKGNNSIEKAIVFTHEVVHGLSSIILNNSGYVYAVNNFIQSINDTNNLTFSFNSNSNSRFSNFLEINLYRITTELINNTLKYARATRAEITFNYQKDKNNIIFNYFDNGIGFDLVNIRKPAKGLGLLYIQQRIKNLRGIIKIETGIGKGIKVYIEIPVI